MEIDVESKQIVDIKKEVEEEALKFRKTTTKEPCQKYFDPKEPADVNWNNKEVYIDALYQGYLDACRTIHWNSISIKTVLRYLLIIDIIRIRWCITRCTMRLKNMELKIM